MMSAFHAYLNQLININERLYEKDQIKWLNQYLVPDFEEIRQQIINKFSSNINWSFHHTKPWINRLSKGCELCGNGDWSCIFITGRCNAKCMYCPAPQNSDDIPTAQQIHFDQAESYADFINYFGFKGVSFSGGEPFLVYEKVIDYLKTIRTTCNPEIYIWLYTNGILTDREKFIKMSKYGLNEVRFDIGATNYKLDLIENAKGIIPNITIEIPMDPDKKELIQSLIPKMIECGVTNLNLHQLRLTKYNAKNLLKNNYTFLHGEHPTVLESELAVLDTINYVENNGYDIGINYCAFQYKNRFQKAGYRKKILEKLVTKGYITENGYMLTLYGSIEKLDGREDFPQNRLGDLINNSIISEISIDDLQNEPDKYSTVIVDFSGLILANPDEKTIEPILDTGRDKYAIQKGKPVKPVIIDKSKIKELINLISADNYSNIPEDKDLFEIWRHLFIEKGFREYF